MVFTGEKKIEKATAILGQKMRVRAEKSTRKTRWTKNSAILLKNLMWLCDVALTIISIGDKCQNDISKRLY